MSFEVKKKLFLMTSQYNQSTIKTVTAISNMFFKQKSEIKIHVVIKICAFFFLLDVL